MYRQLSFKFDLETINLFSIMQQVYCIFMPCGGQQLMCVVYDGFVKYCW